MCQVLKYFKYFIKHIGMLRPSVSQPRILKSSSITTGKTSYLSLHILMGQRGYVASANLKDPVGYQVDQKILPPAAIKIPLFPIPQSPCSISSFQKICRSSYTPKSAQCHITQDWILHVILFPEYQYYSEIPYLRLNET